jgi:hypothetical protein
MTKTATVHAQQRWEYMSISRKTETYLAQELVTLGQDGWELVTVNYARGKKEEMFWTAFLKRPAIGHAVPVTAQEATPARHDPAPTGATASEETKKDPAGSLQGFDLDEGTFAIHEEPGEQK